MNAPDNLTDSDRLALEALCNACVDGTLTDAQRRELEARLLASPEARQFYVRFMALNASLHEYAGESQMEGSPLPKRPSKRLWWLAAAVGAAAAVALVIMLSKPTPEPALVLEDDASGDGVAMLSASENSTWKNGTFQPGQSFAAGEVLNLLSGFAEIAFDCGAKIVLQGPATLEIASAWETALHRGTLRASVPQEAIGFRVRNPEVDVVDLGTDFSVVTDELGASEIFVHEGAVEVHPRQKKSTGPRRNKGVLREKEARRFARTGSSEVHDAEKKWQALGKKKAIASELKSTVIHRFQWNAQGSSELVSLNQHPLKFIPGRRQTALQFDGSRGAQVLVPEWPRDQARTIAAWVRIPADAPLADAPPFISWSRQWHGPQVVELGINDDPALGIVGALELRIGNRRFVGTTVLRDGHWHHVAVVLIRQTRQDKGPMIHQKCFVDGQHEGRSKPTLSKKVRAKPNPVPKPGLYLAGNFMEETSDYFVGDLEGLVIADGSMNQADVVQMMREP